MQADAKTVFLAAHGGGYGYNGQIDAVRQFEFTRLQGSCYLDAAGSAVYSEAQLRAVFAELQSTLLCNPHSDASAASPALEATRQLKQLTLQLCHASGQEYEVILTHGATDALKLVALAFPWQAGSCFAYTLHNHNSVLGIREEARAHGAAVFPVVVKRVPQTQSGEPIFQILPQASVSNQQSDAHESHVEGGAHGHLSSSLARSDMSSTSTPLHLFACPLECNFSGARLDADLINYIKQHGIKDCSSSTNLSQQSSMQHIPELFHNQTSAQTATMSPEHGQSTSVYSEAQHTHSCTDRCVVLLDAAKACATCPPNLSEHPADLVVLSYYKIFGYPTGLGSLLVRKRVLPLLRQRYFSGGTVLAASASELFHQKRCGTAGLEDGTPAFTSIAAARHGFHFLQSLGGMPLIQQHTLTLARYLACQLSKLQHGNSQPACVLYSPHLQGNDIEHMSAGYPAAAADECMHAMNTEPSSGKHDQSRSDRDSATFCADALVAPLPYADNTRHLSQERASSLQESSWLHGSRSRHPESAADTFSFPLDPTHPCGPTVTFNLIRPDGSFVGHREVARLAAIHNIYLRTGCFCNPGACAAALKLSAQDLRDHLAAGHVCWDDKDIINGRPTGAVRVSFGHVSTFEDAFMLLQFVKQYFIEGTCDAANSAIPTAVLPEAVLAMTEHKPQSNQQFTVSQSTAVQDVHQHSVAVLHEEPQDTAFVPVSEHLPVPASMISPEVHGSHTALATMQQLHDVVQALPTNSNGAPAKDDSSHLQAGFVSSHVTLAQPAALTSMQHQFASGSLPVHSQTSEFLSILQSSNRLQVHPVSTLAPSAMSLPQEALVPARHDGVSDPSSTQQALRPCQPQHMHAVQPAARLPSQVATPCPPVRPHGPTTVPCDPVSADQMAGYGTLKRIFVYPVKSCAAMEVCSWPLGPNGLLFDREWALVDDNQRALTQKACPALATLQPHVDLQKGMLVLSAPAAAHPLIVQFQTPKHQLAASLGSFRMPDAGQVGSDSSACQFDAANCNQTHASSICSSADASACSSAASSSSSTGTSNIMLDAGLKTERVWVCGDTVCSLVEGVASQQMQAHMRAWFEAVLGTPCSLVRQQTGSRSVRRPTINAAATGSGLEHKDDDHQGTSSSVGFANDGQFLLVNESSLIDLSKRMATDAHLSEHSADLARFRANLVVGGFDAYAEDKWTAVQVANVQLDALGTCPRCEMLQVDQARGVRVKADLLKTLAQYRRLGGKITFGLLMTQSHEALYAGGVLNVGDSVLPLAEADTIHVACP